jgi:ComF family protein
MHYLPPITALMHAFKDEGQRGCGRLLSACLLRYLQQHGILTNPPEALVPVPLHRQKQRQRGFNQAQEIANYLGKSLAIPVWYQHCSKTKNTPSQQSQKKQQRESNLNQAFLVNQSLAGAKHIAIIDDVVTTGSTVHALAQAIRKSAGADIQISVWCLARTLPPHSQLHLTHYD